jgi:hypothetical protein
MVAKLFDLEANHPLRPHKQVLAEYKKVDFDYEPTVEDRGYEQFYYLVKGRPIYQEVTQIYRIKRPGQGEYLFYNLMLTGEDWKGNPVQFATLEGRYEKPIFKLERDPETNKLSTTQVTSHQRVYYIPYSSQKLEELLEISTDPLSLIVCAPSGKKFGVMSVDEFKVGAIEDLITGAQKGKSLEAVLAEKNQVVYEKRETRQEHRSNNKVAGVAQEELKHGDTITIDEKKEIKKIMSKPTTATTSTD